MIVISFAYVFIGCRLLRALSSDGVLCRGLSRRPLARRNSVVADLSDISGLAYACKEASCVFHCAGYAHAFASLSEKDDAMHCTVNLEGTRNLLEVAALAGVRCFVNLSSVKAMSEPRAICADEDLPGEPETGYGKSKRAAEEVVLFVGKQAGMHVVNLRLAMTYGAGGQGNLERMARLVARGLFPPLPETGNHRSLIHVDDVVAAMRLVAGDPRANGRTYIVTSPEAPSGRGLFDAMRDALGMPRCSWCVPEALLQAAAAGGDVLEALTGRRMPFDRDVLDRLLGSAWYSGARMERELGWRAKVSLSQGLAELVGK